MSILHCAECGREAENILVDEQNEPPLEFCSWQCLAVYAVKKVNALTEEKP